MSYLKLATVHCSNPNCSLIYEAVLEDGNWHATCPDCKQNNRVPATSAGKEITGICDDPNCKRPLDDHMFGRLTFCCPPKKGKSF